MAIKNINNINAKKYRNIKNRKNHKNEKIPAMLTWFCGIVVIICIALMFEKFAVASERTKVLIERKEDYKTERIKGEGLQKKLDAPIDEDYIVEYAQAHGYRKDGDIIFYWSQIE